MIHFHNLPAIFDMVLSAEQDVRFLKSHVLRLWNQEPDEQSEKYIYRSEEVEGEKAGVIEEGREELLDNGIGDVLCLRCHTDSLSANVHTENFSCPDPDGGSPRRFIWFFMLAKTDGIE